jgi:gentisate 1,2-dioxygenase
VIARRPASSPPALPAAAKDGDLLEWLYQLRDRQRANRTQGAWLIKGKDLPWENNAQGRMQWYLHPALENAAIRTMLFFRQEIAPRSRSGLQRIPGGSVIYIVKGRGYSLLDGERHDWEAEDVINVPIRSAGVTLQHFNLDRREPAALICADLNLSDFLGLDRGSGFEQLESAPAPAP